MSFKLPVSVLVVIYAEDTKRVLMLQRRDDPPFWQSVTGSKDAPHESYAATAAREVREETGIDPHAPGCVLRDWGLENVYTIYPHWQHRYAPGVWHNTERVFGLQVPAPQAVALNPHEHTAYA